MDFNKLCNSILKSDKKIRFAGVLDTRGNLVAQKSSSDSSSLLSNEELKMLVYYASDRRNRLQNLQHKLGEVKETITKFENVSTIILNLNQNLFLISTDPSSNNSKIASNIWKIIEKKPVQKSMTKKKPSKRKPTARELEKQKENQKMRIRISKSSRRSGKINKKEGKVSKSKQRAKTPRSQKKIATVRKSRY
ncbi:MAG: hypothetical protein OES14_05495 [Nitrosopumilus sp.]|nr:hypothetical protein [Nitrosopumilus sp.]MDH3825228.1 hypothetical protein [Nitrosopumilus sp.]